MGLLKDTYQHLTTTPDVRYDLMLIRAMALGATASGAPSAAQTAVVRALLLTLPELARQRSAAQLALSAELAAARDESDGETRAQRLASFSALPRVPQRKKCYVVAAEAALAQGPPSPQTRALLDDLRAALRLPGEFTCVVDEVMALPHLS